VQARDAKKISNGIIHMMDTVMMNNQ